MKANVFPPLPFGGQDCQHSMIRLMTFRLSPGVLVLSWYPPGLADDNGEPVEDLVPDVLDAAYRHNLKVKGVYVCVCVCVCVCVRACVCVTCN